MQSLIFNGASDSMSLFMGWGTLWKPSSVASVLRPQTQVQTRPCKEETCKPDPASVSPSSFRTEVKSTYKVCIQDKWFCNCKPTQIVLMNEYWIHVAVKPGHERPVLWGLQVFHLISVFEECEMFMYAHHNITFPFSIWATYREGK